MENVLFMDSRALTAASAYSRSLGREGDLHPDDAAIFAITDFRREYPITVESECSIDEALTDMVRFGLHALLVTRQEEGGLEQQILGLVTAHALERLRRRQPRESEDSKKRADVRVDQAMTPWSELPLIKYEALQSLTAIELYAMFRGTRLTHVLVAETHHEDSALVRGLVSRASLASRLRRHRGHDYPTL
ncbi:MAG: CBS domain-containing protein [Steroidobacteraceae bacterium]